MFSLLKCRSFSSSSSQGAVGNSKPLHKFMNSLKIEYGMNGRGTWFLLSPSTLDILLDEDARNKAFPLSPERQSALKERDLETNLMQSFAREPENSLEVHAERLFLLRCSMLKGVINSI
jgi:hypothetical protein